MYKNCQTAAALTYDLAFEFIPNPALLENCPFFLYTVSTKGRERDPYSLLSCLASPETRCILPQVQIVQSAQSVVRLGCALDCGFIESITKSPKDSSATPRN